MESMKQLVKLRTFVQFPAPWLLCVPTTFPCSKLSQLAMLISLVFWVGQKKKLAASHMDGKTTCSFSPMREITAQGHLSEC